MQIQKKFSFNNLNNNDCYLTFTTVDTCPACKAKISPAYIASSLNDDFSASVFDFCRSCNSAFVTKYKIRLDMNSSTRYTSEKIIYSEPNRFAVQKFDDKIAGLSPQFVKIYNQALAAEVSQLDEIAGLGYRKALEFLVKDFAIHKNPNSAEDIKARPLVQCIKNYIDNTSIVTLAERSAWIGNDEAHYIRKQEDRDVKDMKSFIQAIVYFIGMILITDDAASMTPK